MKLIKKCSDRNEIKKSPESAIATFLAIDDFNIADFAISNKINYCFLKVQQKYTYLKNIATFSH
jgi:hypothetical protein